MATIQNINAITSPQYAFKRSHSTSWLDRPNKALLQEIVKLTPRDWTSQAQDN